MGRGGGRTVACRGIGRHDDEEGAASRNDRLRKSVAGKPGEARVVGGWAVIHGDVIMTLLKTK